MERILKGRENAFFSVLFILAIFFAMLVMSGCATTGSGALSWNKLTPKGKAAMALGLYNDEYDSYMADVKLPNLSEASKDLLKKKRKILVSLHEAITVYSGYAKIGTTPPEDVEATLLKLISQVSVK